MQCDHGQGTAHTHKHMGSADAACACHACRVCLDEHLKAYFKSHDAKLHNFQVEAVQAVMQGKDSFVRSGTGSGKSLCYQFPAYLTGKSVVVVSPLISLMRDQCLSLEAKGVPAILLGSAQKDKQAEPNTAKGKYSVVYVCPESVERIIENGTLPSLARGRGVAVFAIDEAHCVSKWGHDFRPDYLRLSILEQKFTNLGLDIPLMALTATATPRVQQEVIQSLGLVDCRLVVTSCDRPNLRFSVKQARSWENDFAPFITRSKGGLFDGTGPAIVYVPTRKDAEEIGNFLAEKGVKAASYHAALPKEHLRRTHEGFLGGTVQVVVATIAFGMGIDKPNVRSVIHYDWPQSIEALYQEAGRAGRDGLPADCVLFCNLGKVPTLLPNAQRTPQQTEVLLEMLKAVHRYAMATTCRRRNLLAYFGDSVPYDTCDNCDNCCRVDGLTDFTDDARLMLQCVGECESRGDITLTTITKVLTGSTRRGVQMFGLQNVSSFNKGLHHTWKWWRGLGRMLEDRGLVESHKDDMPQNKYARRQAREFVALTQKGRDFLANQGTNVRDPHYDLDNITSGRLIVVLEADMVNEETGGGRSQRQRDGGRRERGEKRERAERRRRGDPYQVPGRNGQTRTNHAKGTIRASSTIEDESDDGSGPESSIPTSSNQNSRISQPANQNEPRNHTTHQVHPMFANRNPPPQPSQSSTTSSNRTKETFHSLRTSNQNESSHNSDPFLHSESTSWASSSLRNPSGPTPNDVHNEVTKYGNGVVYNDLVAALAQKAHSDRSACQAAIEGAQLEGLIYVDNEGRYQPL